MNIGKIIKVILALAILGMIFHPILSIVILVKFGGIFFAITIVSIVLKLCLGMSLIDLFRSKD